VQVLDLAGIGLWGRRVDDVVRAFATCHSLELIDLSGASISTAALIPLREAQRLLPGHLLLDESVRATDAGCIHVT
jgi:hypothetical protein